MCYGTVCLTGSIEIMWNGERGGVRDTKHKHVFEQETFTGKKKK
jgi:hypothetical protein